jgi:RHS repeat-associated protein
LPYPQAVGSIALPDGTSLKYTYDPPPATSAPSTSFIERLVKVERLSAASAVLNSESYLYEDSRFPTHITGVIDNRSIRTKTYAYDAQGRATKTEGPGGANIFTVEYGQNGTARTRRVTNALGKSETYNFASFSAGPADYRLTQVDGEASANTPVSTSSAGFGTDTFVSSQTDAEGHVTTTSRDARGRPVSIVEGSGTSSARTTTVTWHSTINAPVSIVRTGLTETRTYNTAGQLATLTQTDTTSQTVPYSTNGQVRTFTYGWNANGRLLSVNGPLAAVGANDDLTSFAYDTQGNLLTATNAAGQVTTFAGHDANGRPGTMTDANGIVTDYGYDGLGRVQTVTVRHPSNSALNATTTMSYDVVGNVTGVSLPSTDILIMDYDAAGRLASMRAASGERWDYSYDAMGNIAAETVKRTDGGTARRVTRAFDELGRVLRETAGVGHTARWSYDKVGNVISAISPNGHATTAAFDPLDRVVATVAPDTGSTSLAYDARGNIVSHTDPIAVTTQFIHNGFGDVIREVSPDRGTSTYVYDAAGRLTEATDGRGQVVAYTRDYLGRETSKTPQGLSAQTVTYYWDTGGMSDSYAVGRLAKIVDGSGTTKFKFDHRGNLLAKEQTVGATSAAQLVYVYDLADRITQITYPSGRLVQYGYDSKGRVNSVGTKASASVGSWTVVANGFDYEPFGAVKAMALGNGLGVANDWGDDGRLASRRLYRVSGGTNLSYLSYRYDADGNIAAINDNVTPANSVLYGYDSMGRLSLTAVDGGGGAESYAYSSGTNRLSSVTNTSGTRSIAYDARGNTASETRPGGVGVTTAYDGYGRLTGYNRSGGQTHAFAYNGLDDRVTMVRGSDTRRFVYDAGGRVLGEYGNSVADAKAEFIWLSSQATNDNAFGGDDGVGGYAPLAVATPDSLGAIQLNWVHGNHLGVPLVMTNSAGNPATTPNDYLLPGFPGQSRVLSDLYYNRYRDYDPTTGRYIQADPIGLAGGSNVYLYAGGNPVNRTDPSGLIAPIVIAGVCAGGGCEVAGAAILGALWYLTHPFKLPPRDPPIPPAIPRGPSSDPDDCCEAEWGAEQAYCSEKFGVVTWQYGACMDRARQNYLDCRDGLPHRGRWKDRDMGPNLPRPPRKKRRW